VPTLQAFSFAVLTVASRRTIVTKHSRNRAPRSRTHRNGLSTAQIGKEIAGNGFTVVPRRCRQARNDRPLCFECVTDAFALARLLADLILCAQSPHQRRRFAILSLACPIGRLVELPRLRNRAGESPRARAKGAAESKFRPVADTGCDFRQPQSGVLQELDTIPIRHRIR
jgi:hypothetical protein